MSSILQNLLSQRSFSLQRISPATCLQDVADLRPQDAPVKGTLPLGLRCSSSPLFRCRIRGGRYYYSPSVEDAAAAALASLEDTEAAATSTDCCAQQEAASPAAETQGPDAFSVHELLDRVFLTGELFAYVEDHCQLPLCSEEIQEAVIQVRDAQTKLYNLFGELSAETPAPSFAQAMAALDAAVDAALADEEQTSYDDTNAEADQDSGDSQEAGVRARLVEAEAKMTELQDENRELQTVVAGLKSRLQGIAQEL